MAVVFLLFLFRLRHRLLLLLPFYILAHIVYIVLIICASRCCRRRRRRLRLRLFVRFNICVSALLAVFLYHIHIHYLPRACVR